MSHGKKYTELKKQIPMDPVSLEEGVKIIKGFDSTKFNSTCELHAKLGIDPRQATQTIRTNVVLPNGTGKEVRVIAFCTDDKVADAKKAGAIEAGIEKLIEKITDGWMDFDTAVAEPAAMKSLGKIAKNLGQKGLMPNPKAGTVGPDVVKMIEEIKKGKIELRNDKFGNIHTIFGKVDFAEDKLLENVQSLVKTLQDVKPSDVKGTYIKSLTLSTTMSPSVKIDTNTLK